MPTPAFEYLLKEARKAHATLPSLSGFCPFPDDLLCQPLAAHHVPAADLMASDTGLNAPDPAPLRDAILAASADAQWRETYKSSGIGEDFLSRFGCYCLIGDGGGWISRQMASYVVYMPPGLYYPWHHHPAEELYVVIAGQAEFLRAGAAPETRGPGQSAFHASGQPHALRTCTHPVMAYVVWRSHLGILPVWTGGQG